MTTNSVGEKVESWDGDAYLDCWAEIQPLNGKEFESAQQVHGQVDHKIYIRYDSQVRILHRCYFGSRAFEINAVINPQEENVMLILYCREIV